jgi:CMP-N,N'-diacetyllegionaminic acid synthase
MKKPDLVVFLQATSPLRRKDDISSAINKIIDKGVDSLFSSRKIEGFIWKEYIESIKPINYDYGNRPMRQGLKIDYKE